MDKQNFIAALAVVACSAALAQAPKGTLDTPPAQINPMASGGAAQAAAEMGGYGRAMDVNGDGMISQKEWDRHHADMWRSMKAMRKNGAVPMSEVETRMRGTPK